MDRNFFIALGVALLFYMGYVTMFPQQKPDFTQQAAIQETAEAPAAAKTAVTAAGAIARPVATIPTHEKESTYTVETENADITFTSKGAAVKNFLYKDVIEPVDLASYGEQGYFSTLPDINFKRVQDDPEADITFAAEIAPGLTFYKSFYFDKDGGINNLRFKFVNKTNQDLDIANLNLILGPGLATVKSEESENEANWRAVCAARESADKKLSVNKIKEKHMKTPSKMQEDCEGWTWAGIDNRYFLAAFIPQDWETGYDKLGFSEAFTHNKDTFFGLFGKKPVLGPKLYIALPNLIAANSTVVYNADFYFGPKDYRFLESLPYNLERSIQFGFFGQFGRWAKWLLTWLYGITGNYGWAIVLMTFLIQIVLLPLTYKQLKSSMVMQKIQPEMKRIQQKFKSDPALQQKETMALYKKYGANPFTGCLPLFIQLPIFLALFNALRTSWELHGAPFIFWIQDLSAKDPFFVLPIAMGAMMFFQQKMTMPNIDKDNPSMAAMKYMPIFMTVIFLNFPAGLTLYWFVSNCISFVVNIVLKKRLAKQFA